jgi:hypothetical protein
MSGLSSKSAGVLELIAQGCTYTQIINHYPDLPLPDIFEAAAEALKLLSSPSSADHATPTPPDELEAKRLWMERMAAIKSRHPRAYAPWSPEEDQRLTTLFKGGVRSRQIADEFQRQPSAIRSRLRKLNLDG